MAQALCCLKESGRYVVTGVITTFSAQENWVTPSFIMFHQWKNCTPPLKAALTNPNYGI